jgi:hypothetical protein
MEITGYKYLIEESAIDAVELCNNHYGIPVSPDDETKNWCEYKYDDYYVFYYIIYDQSLEVVLGQPITFDINIPID